MRPPEAATPPPKVENLPPNTTIVTIGGNAIQLKGGDQDLKLEFGKQETYKDGETKLFNVKVLANNRSGRNYTITGDQAQVGKDESSYHINGNVRMETSDGLVAHAGEATYAD